MDEEEIRRKICSVFEGPMRKDPAFPFSFLQNTGGGTNSLSIVNVSSNWSWSAQQVASLGGQGAIYIIAEKELELNVSGKFLTKILNFLLDINSMTVMMKQLQLLTMMMWVIVNLLRSHLLPVMSK